MVDSYKLIEIKTISSGDLKQAILFECITITILSARAPHAVLVVALTTSAMIHFDSFARFDSNTFYMPVMQVCS